MRSYCSCTPYTLNLKLKCLYPASKSNDINKLYKNLSDSIPEITNQFCCLKNRTKALNKSLNKIPIIYNNTFTTNRSNSYYFSKNINTSPNISDSYYNCSYISPKPVLKPYQNDNIKYQNQYQYHNNLLNNKYNIKYKCGHCGNKNFKNIKFNLNYDSYNDKPIRYYNKLNNRNYSAINMVRNDHKYGRYHNLDNYDFNNKNNNYFNKSNYINDLNKYQYDQTFQKLNKEICKKDKIIHQMQDVIDDTVDKLNKKNHENSKLQSELLELKAKSNYNMNKNFNNMNVNNNGGDKENKKGNNNYIQKRFKKNKNKKRYYNLNNYKYNSYNNNKNFKNYYNNKSDDDNMDLKWEEIRKLNKKMDNLLYKNENKLKKYEKINGSSYKQKLK